MRISLLFGLLGFLGMITTVSAANGTVKVIDDFSAANGPHNWKARSPNSQVTYEKEGLLLKLAKYTGEKGESMWPGMVRGTVGLELERYNGLLIDLTNPTDQTQSIAETFKDGRNMATMLHRVGPKQRQELRINFDRMASGLVDWTKVESITLSWTMPSTPQVWLVHRISLFCDDPSTTEMGRLQTLLKDAQESFQQAQSANVLTPRQSQEGKQTLSRWDSALRSHEGIAGKSDACKNELSALISELRVATLAKQLNKPAVLWTVPPGTRFEPAGAMPQYRKPLDKLQLVAARSEYADGIVRLTNLSESAQQWRVTIAAKAADDQGKLSIRRNQAVMAVDGSVVGDALIPLDGAGTISVAPGQSAEFWVRADARHHKWTPGEHLYEIQLVDLLRGHTSRMALPVEVTIHSFNLDAAGDGLKAGLWAPLFSSRSAEILGGRQEAALDNLIDYGVNVFNIYPDAVPWPKLSPQGDWISRPDYKEFDRVVKFLQSRTKPLILIWLRMDSGAEENYELQSGLKPGSPQWKKGLHNWLSDWTQHMGALGLRTSDYAFYVTDEPDAQELDRTRLFGEVAKAIDSSVQIYVDGSDLYDDPDLNKQLMAVTDIWQPDETAGFDGQPGLLKELKSYPNHTLWVYACRTGRRARNANAYEYYRLMAWRAIGRGLSGIGYWTYSQPSGNENLWDGTVAAGSGATLVYPGKDKSLIMSVRWELIRMALDDAKYYRLLQQTVQHTVDAKTKTQIADLLGGRFQDVIAHPNDPSGAVQWRIDAGAALDAAAKTGALQTQ
jgi:hypothetical protein